MTEDDQLLDESSQHQLDKLKCVNFSHRLRLTGKQSGSDLDVYSTLGNKFKNSIIEGL